MATEYDIARDQYQNYRYNYENGHQQWLDIAAKCVRYRNNQQWDAGDLAALRLAKRPALTLNLYESLITSAKGIQRALRNDIRFQPVSEASGEDAEVMDSVWLHIANENELDFVESENFERGYLMGRAFYDVRVEFDDNLQGDVKIRAPRSQDVVMNPGVDSYDPDTWPDIIEARWINLLDVEHRFGKDVAEALRNRGVPNFYEYEDEIEATQMGRVIPMYGLGWETLTAQNQDLIRGFRYLDRQYFKLKTKELFIDTHTGDTKEIPDNWDRERIGHLLSVVPGISTTKRKVKTVRWTTTCEDIVLHDDDSPYKSFTMVGFFPKFFDGATPCPAEYLLDAQDMFNKISSQEVHIINTSANSGYKVKTGSLKNMTVEELEVIGSKAGFVAELDHPDDLEKITPNGTPTGHDRISQKADQVIRSLMGISNQSRGFAREDVAGEAILANQAASDVNFADMLSKLHRTKQLLAKRVMDCVQTFYTETRVLMINKGTLYRPEYEQLTLNKPTAEGTMLNDITAGKYTTTLVPSATRSSLTDDEMKTLGELRKNGVKIPDIVFLELAPLHNKSQIIKQVQGDSAQEATQQHQMEIQSQQEELALTAAKTQKEQGAAKLNEARAQKAMAEAQRDPDEGYKQVEGARIASESQIAREKTQAEVLKAHMGMQTEQMRTGADLAKTHMAHGLEREKMGLQRRTQDHATALGLTREHMAHRRHGADTVMRHRELAQADQHHADEMQQADQQHDEKMQQAKQQSKQQAKQKKTRTGAKV